MKKIRKLFAMLLALAMMVACVSAGAEAVKVGLKVDGDGLKSILAGFGMQEDQMTIVDPILGIVNALGVKVTTVSDGAQVDLSLNDADALSLGFATGEEGYTVVSSLFPNYMLTSSAEAFQAMTQSFMASMPLPGVGGASGEMAGGFDLQAMAGPVMALSEYFSKYGDAVGQAAVPGQPVPGDYEFDGVKFNTYVPITVDVPAMQEATRDLVNKLLADETVMGMIQGMGQGMSMGGTGASFNVEDLQKSLDDFIDHFPANVTADFYNNADREDDKSSYVAGQATYEGQEDSAMTYTMLLKDEKTGKMTFGMPSAGLEVAVQFAENYFRADVSASGMFSALPPPAKRDFAETSAFLASSSPCKTPFHSQPASSLPFTASAASA